MIPLYLLHKQFQKPVPGAVAKLTGSSDYPDIRGTVRFYAMEPGGIIIEADIYNLPSAPADYPTFFAMHLHENGDCGDGFSRTGSHYNPYQTSHPHHAGDFPPLLNNDGFAWMSFYDSYLSLEDVAGKSVVIHAARDDFSSQPAGDSGDKIACGVVVKLK